MRYVDMENWPRRRHFDLFSQWDLPHFNLCANVDVTAFRPFLKEYAVSFTLGVMYVIARAANAIPEFRQRIRDGAVVEHDVVHPATTILLDDDTFSFYTVEYAGDLMSFARRGAAQIAHVCEHPTLDDGPEPDSLLFMTSIPWVSFTNILHPLHLNPVDSVPRFAWGKFFEGEGRLQMPLSVQAHHALVDGLHAGRFYEMVQEHLDRPAFLLEAPGT